MIIQKRKKPEYDYLETLEDGTIVNEGIEVEDDIIKIIPSLRNNSDKTNIKIAESKIVYIGTDENRILWAKENSILTEIPDTIIQ